MSFLEPESPTVYVIVDLKQEDKHCVRLYLHKIVGYEMKGDRLLAITAPLKGTKFNEMEPEEYPAIRSKTEAGDRMLQKIMFDKKRVVGMLYEKFFREYRIF